MELHLSQPKVGFMAPFSRAEKVSLDVQGRWRRAGQDARQKLFDVHSEETAERPSGNSSFSSLHAWSQGTHDKGTRMRQFGFASRNLTLLPHETLFRVIPYSRGKGFRLLECTSPPTEILFYFYGTKPFGQKYIFFSLLFNSNRFFTRRADSVRFDSSSGHSEAGFFRSPGCHCHRREYCWIGSSIHL